MAPAALDSSGELERDTSALSPDQLSYTRILVGSREDTAIFFKCSTGDSYSLEKEPPSKASAPELVKVSKTNKDPFCNP